MLSARLALVALRAVARYLRISPIRLGKPTLLRIARNWLVPAARRSCEVVRLADAPAAQMRCFGVGSGGGGGGGGAGGGGGGGGSPRPDILTEWLLFTGRWQPALTRWLCATLQPGDVFVDVGANSGYFALLAAARGCRVVAVEACPTTFETLRSNLALNGQLGGRVRALQLAAGDADGRVTLYQHRNEPLYNTTVRGAGAGGVAAATDVWSVLQKSAALDAAAASAVSALAAERACWREVQVPQASLDDVLAGDERAPRVVKIDVEGGEWAVLRGMESMLRQNDAPIEIVVELSPKWLKLQSTSARALLDYMRERGFHAYALPADDYEIARCHDAPPTAPPRPRRLHAAEAERLDAAADGAQLDVIFSRRDAEWLQNS